jgi:hypothetical protein
MAWCLEPTQAYSHVLPGTQQEAVNAITEQLQTVANRVANSSKQSIIEVDNRSFGCRQLNIHREWRRGYWPCEASGNLAYMAKVPKPAR